MPLTLAAEPTTIEEATRYARQHGTTLESLVLSYIESIAKRQSERHEQPRPAFLDVRYRLSEEGASELMAAQKDFEKVETAMWK